MVDQLRTQSMPPLFDAPSEVVKAATLSKCGRYRYTLERTWSDDPPVLFVMLNPSTADASEDDPTIKKCMGFAERWGHGGITVVNLYAWRATDPKDLPTDISAVGEGVYGGLNDAHIQREADKARRIIAAWGANSGPLKNRAGNVVSRLRGIPSDFSAGRKIEALRLTKDGHPWHPLYVPYDVTPVPYG